MTVLTTIDRPLDSANESHRRCGARLNQSRLVEFGRNGTTSEPLLALIKPCARKVRFLRTMTRGKAAWLTHGEVPDAIIRSYAIS